MAYASMHHLATYNPQLRRSLPHPGLLPLGPQTPSPFSRRSNRRRLKQKASRREVASVGREGDQDSLLKLSSSTSRLQVQLFRDNPIRHRFSASNIQKAGFHLGALPFSQGFLCHHAKDSVSFRTM